MTYSLSDFVVLLIYILSLLVFKLASNVVSLCHILSFQCYNLTAALFIFPFRLNSRNDSFSAIVDREVRVEGTTELLCQGTT